MASDGSENHSSTSRQPHIDSPPRSYCWVGSPDLRPLQTISSRDEGGPSQEWDPLPDPANEATDGTRGQNGWEADMPYAFSSTPCPSTVSPFRFLELPQEIQKLVYNHVYEEKQPIRVFMVRPTAPNGRYHRLYDNDGLSIRGYDYETLAQVSKKVREDSREARQESFDGEMKVFWDKGCDSTPFNKICEPRWALLRDRITKLVVDNVSSGEAGNNFFEVLRGTPIFFPRVAEIRVHYNTDRYLTGSGIRPGTSFTPFTIFDEAYKRRFDTGKMDGQFRYPSARLGLPGLARVMEEASRPCTISLQTTIHWQTFAGELIHSLHVKFPVTTQGLSEAVERIWCPVR
ncbi:hypothetical protein AYL99_11697 [Fonsecaea erecta]|uniref:Uncharacterized protein n=1 Tax=Fonsecaea erecta TaxID=1367422 RepID=A0A178Z311_9EURO|nr:hypothetical protein AYL99_11697 [Fonsecaea erecta]OAP54162.1 hypothetical protein AYL99_11697 [Fonsecaea erecta]